MSEPTLSFCITTRNRARFLRETLRSVASQASADVEVVIVDAASEDETTQVVESFRDSLPSLCYERRVANGGIDRDFARAAELARGRYFWFFSDDDALVPGALESVLEATREDYALIVANAEDRDSELKQLLREKRLAIPRDRTYGPADHIHLFMDIAGYLSFIPGVIVRRDVWNSRQRDNFLGTLFAHVGVLFQEPLPGDARVLARPLVSIRNGTVSWADRSFEIWMFLWPRLIWSLTSLPEAARRKVTPREPWRSPRELLVYRAMAGYSSRDYRVRIADSGIKGVRRLVCKIIAAAPGRLVNALALAYCLVLRRSDRFTIYNLKRSTYYWRGSRARGDPEAAPSAPAKDGSSV